MKRLLVAALVVVLAVSGWLHWALFRSGPPHETEVRVEPGTAELAVLHDLRELGLIPSVAAARLYLAMRRDAGPLRYGTYLLAPGSRPVDVLERLLAGVVETLAVTVVEGLPAEDVVEVMVSSGVGSSDGWRTALARVDWIRDLAPEAVSLEGFLFPDTYRFAPDTDAEAAARHLVGRFRTVWREEQAGVVQPWGSTLEVVTLASLVEAESNLDEERPVIAGVFLRRLERGMLLQCDPTVVYALRRQSAWSGRLTRRHWTFDDPYNTYLHPGLPPGPINSPGRTSIRASLSPEITPFLYFVARPEGGHAFSRTLEEHNRAVARLRRSRR